MDIEFDQGIEPAGEEADEPVTWSERAGRWRLVAVHGMRGLTIQFLYSYGADVPGQWIDVAWYADARAARGDWNVVLAIGRRALPHLTGARGCLPDTLHDIRWSAPAPTTPTAHAN